MFEAYGVKYQSIRKACEKFHIKENTYYKRRRSGMSKEDALQNVNYKHSSSTCGKPIEVDGVSYPSISAARRAFGVNERAYYRRVEHGMTPEEALKLGNKRKNAKEITVNGKHFPSQKSAVRYYKADKAYYLMKKYGISLEEAIMRVVNERKGRTAALQ